jgi:prephenate dehydrogenase
VIASRVSTVGFVGFGAFGRFAAGHLAKHARVLAYDVRDIADEARAAGATPATLEETSAADAVVLCVPAQHLGPVAAAVGRNVRPGAIVLDVCSVKIRPLAVLVREIPAHAEVVGTHPLLGPQSGKDGIAGLPIAVCDGRTNPGTLAAVREFLSRPLGLRVIDTTPDEHDRAMAYVQGLTHLISRAVGELPLPETPLATVAYERLLAMRSNLRFDSWELFVTIERENPYAAEARRLLRRKLDEIEQRLGG